jgi:hypothetical protein
MRVIITRKQAKRLLKQIPIWLDEQFDEIVLYDDEYPEMVKFVEVRR